MPHHSVPFDRQRRGSRGPLSPKGSGLPPASEPAIEAGQTAVDVNPGLDAKPSSGSVILESKVSSGTAASVRTTDSFKGAKFYDAKSTTLPVYGKRITDADIIEGPMEAEPQV